MLVNSFFTLTNGRTMFPAAWLASPYPNLVLGTADNTLVVVREHHSFRHCPHLPRKQTISPARRPRSHTRTVLSSEPLTIRPSICGGRRTQ